MSPTPYWILLGLSAFTLGSIPFGLLLARIFVGKDVRSEGSGNVGATNVTRVAGFWPAGFLTFLFDFSKGFVPLVLVHNEWLPSVFQDAYNQLGPSSQEWMLWGLALLSVLGHCYSPFLKFNGGKGVATALGVVSVLSPWAAFAGVLAFGATYFHTRLGSLSSLNALMIVAIVHVATNDAQYPWIFGMLILWVIVVRHDSNLESLLEGSERTVRPSA